MKKGSKPLIFSILFLLVSYSMLMLGYVSVKLECEILTKKKFDFQRMLDSKRNKQINLVAEAQTLLTEERITKIAAEELNMIKRSEQQLILSVSRERIAGINEVLEEKYE